MKKLFLVISVFLLCTMPVSAITLKGSVEYTVDTARAIAFENASYTIPTSEFNSYLLDIFYYSNIKAIKNGQYNISIGHSRRLVPFFSKNNKLLSYGVQTEDQPNKKYYYDLNGRLIKYEINTFNGTYPYKTTAYDKKGKLLNIHLLISEKESFIFDKNEKLLGHWLNDKCYNEKGKIILTRRL